VLLVFGTQHNKRICPICHLWPASIHNVFPHFLINTTTSEKKVIESKMCGLNGILKVLENGTVNRLILLSVYAQTTTLWDWSYRQLYFGA